MYAHFQHEGIWVRVGERVARGQPLGAIGESGTPTPCAFMECGILHFGIYAAWPATEQNELPLNFLNAQGPLDVRGGLAPGAAYLARPY